FILSPLNEEYGAVDRANVAFDAAVRRPISRPRLDQSAKQQLSLVAVIACKPRFKIPALKIPNLIGYGCNRSLLPTELRTEGTQPTAQVRKAAGERQCNPRAVGVPN